MLDTYSFFNEIYGKNAPGQMTIWTPQDKETIWIDASYPEAAAAQAIKLSKNKDVYFGVGTRKEKLEEGRGKAEDVIAIPGAWADVDVKGGAHKQVNLPPTVEDALGIIEAIPYPPTLIVNSGHGLQPWWLFKELWNLESEEEREEARNLVSRVQATLRESAKQYGWHVDSTYDLARVLRPPGTYNRKLEPVEVKVLQHNPENRYHPRDFEPYLLGLGPKKEREEVHFSDNGHGPEGAKATLKRVREKLSGRILRTIEEGPQAFEPKPGGDSSSSGADAAVCTALINAGLTDNQIRAIFEIYPIGSSGKYAERGDEYLAGTLKKQRVWFKANAKEEDHPEAAWEKPIPLPEGLPPVATLDPAMLPVPLRDWIMDVSERMQIPPDFLAASAIVVAASLVGRKLGALPKQHDDWLVVPNLWGAVIGRPSLLKSPALAEAMKPLDRLVAEAYKQHEKNLEAYEAEVEATEAMKRAFQNEIKKAAAKSVRPDGNREQLDELIAKERAMEPPEKPTIRRYKTSDATTEKLTELSLDNPLGFLNQRDELSGWLRSLDKQGREGDRAFYLESWNGTGSFDVDRIGRGSLHVPALCLSILGGIQPGPLSSYVYDATQGRGGDDGLLQRFQILVWPDAPKEWRNEDRHPNTEAKSRAYETFRRLDTLTAEEFGATYEGEDEIPAVRFTPEAQEVFDKWRYELETALRREDLAPALEAHLAKYRSLMPSLALLFQLMEFVDGTGDGGAIGIEATLQAASWCEYLRTHAERLYSSAQNPAMEAARALLAHIRKGDVKDGCTLREIYRKQWTKLSHRETANAAVEVLEAFGWLQSRTIKTEGRSTTRIYLHPNLKGET